MTCKHCQQPFDITDQDLAFYADVSPTIGGKKQLIPPPTHCPDCRKQRRHAWRNERKLYHRQCNKCHKEIISIYAADKPYQAYCLTCWWDPSHDPTQFGQDYNFSKTFFTQYDELLKKVPLPALVSSPDAEENNCSYINFAGNSKNCYLTFDADFNEDSYYSNVLKHSRNCMECSYVQESELCYEVTLSTGCYHLFFSEECTNCRDSYFLKNCLACSDCLLCVNLQHKQYCILNKQYTKEQYEDYLSKLDFGDRTTIESLMKQYQELVVTAPCKYIHGVNLENCSGDYMINAKNCDHCFSVGTIEDSKYCDSLYRSKDCMDVSAFGENIQRVYEGASIGIDCYDIHFSQVCATSAYNLQYNFGSRVSKNSFGCVALKQNEYCILNKQYTKDEYEVLVPKIIEQMRHEGAWGEFWPMAISPFAYNESAAQELFPLNKEQALNQGATWREEELGSRYEGPKTTVPSNIKDAQETIIKDILTCERCQKNYKIIAQELAFYQSQHFPLPQFCFSCRHELRMNKKNPQKLWDRNCESCKSPFKTSYAPERPEKIYCEQCYQKLVIS